MAADVVKRPPGEVLRYEVLEAFEANQVGIKGGYNPHKPSGKMYLEREEIPRRAVISAWLRHLEKGNEVWIKNYPGQKGRGVWCALRIDPDDQLTHYSSVQEGYYGWVLDIHAHDTGY